VSSPEFRIAKEGRPWVVRKRFLRPLNGRPAEVWSPVWYAASEERAREYVKHASQREE